MSVSITVQTREGVFVYGGEDQKGDARWVFAKPDRKGKLRARPMPRRMKSIVDSEKRNRNGRTS